MGALPGARDLLMCRSTARPVRERTCLNFDDSSPHPIFFRVDDGIASQSRQIGEKKTPEGAGPLRTPLKPRPGFLRSVPRFPAETGGRRLEAIPPKAFCFRFRRGRTGRVDFGEMRRPCMGWYTACPGFLFAACMTGVLLGRGLLVSWSGLEKDVLAGQVLRKKAVAAAAEIKLSGAGLGQPYRAVLLRI